MYYCFGLQLLPTNAHVHLSTLFTARCWNFEAHIPCIKLRPPYASWLQHALKQNAAVITEAES